MCACELRQAGGCSDIRDKQNGGLKRILSAPPQRAAHLAGFYGQKSLRIAGPSALAGQTPSERNLAQGARNPRPQRRQSSVGCIYRGNALATFPPFRISSQTLPGTPCPAAASCAHLSLLLHTTCLANLPPSTLLGHTFSPSTTRARTHPRACSTAYSTAHGRG